MQWRPIIKTELLSLAAFLREWRIKIALPCFSSARTLPSRRGAHLAPSRSGRLRGGCLLSRILRIAPCHAHSKLRLSHASTPPGAACCLRQKGVQQAPTIAASGQNLTQESSGFPTIPGSASQVAGSKRQILSTLMFAVSSCRREYSFARDRAFQIDRR